MPVLPKWIVLLSAVATVAVFVYGIRNQGRLLDEPYLVNLISSLTAFFASISIFGTLLNRYSQRENQERVIARRRERADRQMRVNADRVQAIRVKVVRMRNAEEHYGLLDELRVRRLRRKALRAIWSVPWTDIYEELKLFDFSEVLQPVVRRVLVSLRTHRRFLDGFSFKSKDRGVGLLHDLEEFEEMCAIVHHYLYPDQPPRHIRIDTHESAALWIASRQASARNPDAWI